MSEKQQPRTILSVDDHELVRLGLRQLIVQHFAERFEVEEAHNLEQALLFLKHRADEVLLLLLDLNLGDTRGLAGLQLLRRSHPALAIAVVSGTNDPRVREEVLGHGAVGYFAKTGDTDDLKELLDTIDRAAATSTTGQYGAASPAQPGRPDALARCRKATTGLRLTSRQTQVLELILSGLDNQAITAETGLALGTVKNCVSSIFLAFNVRSRAELMGLFS